MNVSIILATKNRPLMLPKAIASVLVQTDPHWELVVLDNGKSVENLMPRDPRVKYYNREATGPADAYSQALSLATGDIVMPLADDDTLAPNAVATILERIGLAEWGYARTAFQRDGDTIFLLGNFWDVEALKKGYYLGGAVFWRKRLSDRLGGFDPEYEGAADYELYLRFGLDSEPAYIRDQILYYYNDWEGTDSRRHSNRQGESNQKIWSRYA